MRILILSQHFPPEPIVRLRDLTQYLARQGHEVSVLTTFPSYPLGRVYDGYALALTANQQELGVPVHRVFAVPYRGTPAGAGHTGACFCTCQPAPGAAAAAPA